MNRFIARFLKDESGATAIEYGLIAAGIAIVCIAAIGAVGTDLRALFTAIAAGI
jgi:pilus assembly protein Flp/PilA